MMTKKNYVQIAKLIHARRNELLNTNSVSAAYMYRELEHMTYLLAMLFIEDNPKFNASKFYKASGIELEKG